MYMYRRKIELYIQRKWNIVKNSKLIKKMIHESWIIHYIYIYIYIYMYIHSQLSISSALHLQIQPPQIKNIQEIASRKFWKAKLKFATWPETIYKSFASCYCYK